MDYQTFYSETDHRTNKLATLIRNEINGTQINKNHQYLITNQIEINENKEIFVANIYIPHQHEEKKQALKELEETLIQINNLKQKKEEIIIIGDFNTNLEL